MISWGLTSKKRLIIEQWKYLSSFLIKYTNSKTFFLLVSWPRYIKKIRALHANKAHGCGNILIRKRKICDESVVNPLSIIYQKCLSADTFYDIWKKQTLLLSIKMATNKLLITTDECIFSACMR